MGIALAEAHADARISLVRQQHEARLGILAQIVLVALCGIHQEAFHVGIAVVVGIVEHRRPHLFGLEFLDAQDVVLEMVVRVERGDVEIAVVEYHEHLVVVGKFAEKASVLVEIQSLYVGVEPHLPPAECGVAMTLQADAMHGVAREQIALRTASLDADVGEIALQKDFFAWVFRKENRVERHLDDLGLAVRIGREIEHLRAWLALCGVHLAVARDARHVEALDEARAVFSVAIDEVVGRARVVFLEHLHVEHVFAYKQLVGHAHHLEFSVAVEDDDIVDVGAVAHEFVFLQTRSDEALLTVDVEFLVGLHHFRGHDGVEVADFSATRMRCAVFFLDLGEPLDGDVGHVGKVVYDFLDFGLNAGHQLVGLVFVELQDALHLDFQEAKDVIARHLANQVFLERFQPFIDVRHNGVERLGLLEFLVFVDAFFDENALERGEKILLFEFMLANFELQAQQAHRGIDVAAQHVAHGQELRFLVVDDAAVWRDVDFAVGEGIERVDGLVRRHARRQMHLDFHVGSRVVIDFLGLDFSLFDGFQNRLDERDRGLGIGNFADDERFLVEFLDFCTHFQHAAALSVVVFRHVDAAARREVGEKLEILAAQVAHGSVAQLVEVVRKHLCR